MATTTALTARDLLTLEVPDGIKHYELSEGELIPVPHPNKEHEDTKAISGEALIVFNAQHRIGRVYVEAAFLMAGGGVRIPDVAFVSAAKLALPADRRSTIPYAPDLAIELISDSETVGYSERKVREYFASGVEEVWQLYPEFRLVRVRTREGIRDLGPGDTLSTPVLPGFSVAVKALFPEG